MNKIKCLYTIILSIIFTGNIISMEYPGNKINKDNEEKKEDIIKLSTSELIEINPIHEKESQSSSLPKELLVDIMNQAILPYIKKAINNSYNDIFNKPQPKTIKVNLNKFKGFRDSSGYIYDLINNHLESKSFKNIIDNLKQKRFDELLEHLKKQAKKEYEGLSKEDLNEALTDILNKWVTSKEDLETVVKLMLADADINATGRFGRTALILASIKGDKDIVKILLDKGADVNAKDNDGDTALIKAYIKGNKDIVKMLLDKGADVNIQYSFGHTILMHESERGDKEIVKMLLDKGADVNVKDRWGTNALIRAIIKGYKEIVEILIDKGADVNATSNDGDTALIEAYIKGDKDIVKMLLDKGADINIQDSFGHTILMLASERGDKEILEMLKEAGPNKLNRKIEIVSSD